MKISVKSVHFSADSKLVSYIEQKVISLSKMFDKITSAEVHLKLQDSGGKVKDKITEIHLHVPGGWIVDKKTSKKFETSVNASVGALKRQVVKHKEKVTGHPRHDD